MRDQTNGAESWVVELADPAVHGIEGDEIAEAKMRQRAGQYLVAGNFDIADPRRLSNPGAGDAHGDHRLHTTIECAVVRA